MIFGSSGLAGFRDSPPKPPSTNTRDPIDAIAFASLNHPLNLTTASPLVTRPPAVSDDLGHLIHLSLRTSERSESLLRELTGTLVLAVAEKFDDTALVGCEAVIPESNFVSHKYLLQSAWFEI